MNVDEEAIQYDMEIMDDDGYTAQELLALIIQVQMRIEEEEGYHNHLQEKLKYFLLGESK